MVWRFGSSGGQNLSVILTVILRISLSSFLLTESKLYMMQDENRSMHLSNIIHGKFVFEEKLGISLDMRYVVSDFNLGMISTQGYGWCLKGLHLQQVVLAVKRKLFMQPRLKTSEYRELSSGNSPFSIRWSPRVRLLGLCRDHCHSLLP